MGCFDMVESIYGNTPDVLSQLIRAIRGRLLLLILTGLIPIHWAERTVRGCSALAAGLLLTGGLRLLGDGGGNFTLLLAALWLLAGMLQRRFPKRKGQKSGRKRDFL